MGTTEVHHPSMKTTFSQLEPAPLSNRIAHLIEEAIMNGTMKQGERINTDALARQFKVSHIPIREALKKLEAVGLIVREVNKSARVLELSRDDVKHIFEVRKVLEGLAVSLAADHLDSRSKDLLQSLVDRMWKTAKSKDFVRMFAADKEFHQIIWDLSGNPFLVKSLSTLLSPYFGFLATRGYFSYKHELSYVPTVHQEVLDAIAKGDGDEARQVLIDVHNRSMHLMLKD